MAKGKEQQSVGHRQLLNLALRYEVESVHQSVYVLHLKQDARILGDISLREVLRVPL